MLKTRIDDIEVRVTVPRPWLSKDDKSWLLDARDVAANIKRHVDDIGCIDIHVERTTYCGFCGDTEQEPYYCCDKSYQEIGEQEKVEFGL